MPATLHSRILSVRIERPLDAAYEFLVRPENWPRWAAGLGGSLTPAAGEWIATGPDGLVRVRFTPRNAFGVLDHWVTLPSGVEIAIPMRLIANGGGCELAFTLFRTPGMTDAIFARDAGMVERDLRALKALLEGDG